MQFEQNLIEAAAGLFDLVNKRGYEKYKPIWKAVLSQWVLESGWGESKLAKMFNNFGGMKFRHGIAIGLKAYLVDILDWNDKSGQYFALKNAYDYAELYFEFIERPIYKDVLFDNDYNFLKTLAESGYVHEMPDGKGGIIKGDELPIFYTTRILEIKKSEKFTELIKIVLEEVKKEKSPDWINLGFYGAL